MKTNRRLLSALMAIVMIFTMAPVGLMASAESTYVISTAEELKTFATNFNDGKIADDVTTVQLANDIDMEGATSWTPIGTSKNPFDLIFDGNGKVIKNFKIESSTKADIAGLFGYVSGTVKNLAVTDSTFTYTAAVTSFGTIASHVTADGKIQGCAVYNTSIDLNVASESLTGHYFGGLVGTLNGTVNESYSKANISVSDTYGINFAAGIAGNVKDDAAISNCYNAGNIAAVNGVYNIVGGIAGRVTDAVVGNSYNIGLANGPVAAAIVGWSGDTTAIVNCYYLEGSSAYEYQMSTNDGYVGTAGTSFTLSAGLTAESLNVDDTAFEDTSRADYAFPLLKNNSFDDAVDTPDEDTTNFAGGIGTIYSPYVIKTVAQLQNVKNYLNSAFIVAADTDIEIGTFEPIGSTSTPFTGYFDGNGATFRGLIINSTAAEAAMFISNYGTIKDFTVTEVAAVATIPATYDEEDSTIELTPEVPGTAAIPSSVTINTTEDNARAAVVAVYNNGTISGITTDAYVTLNSDQLHAYAAGIAVENNGTISGCTNQGNIVVDNTRVIKSNYKDVYENAVINVAGLVAINNAKGTVSGSSSNTARSVIASALDTDGIVTAQYVAVNNGSSENVTGTTEEAKYNYFNFELGVSAIHTSEDPYTSEGDEPKAVSLTDSTAYYNGTADTTTVPTIAYSTLVDNYQSVTLTYTEGEGENAVDYKVVFFAWLDYSTITASYTSDLKTSYLLGEKFSTAGITVKGKDTDGKEVEIPMVESSVENGYTVKVYDIDDTEFASPIEDLSAVTLDEDETEHDYIVKLYYYGSEIEGSSYTITVYGIESLKVTTDYTTYLVGATPEVNVRAVYADENNTERAVAGDFTYAIGSSKDGASSATYGTSASFTDDGTYYVYAKANGITGTSDAITVIESDATVSNLKATAGAVGNKVACDNIKLTWEFDGAESKNVTFKIERKLAFSLDGISGLDLATIIKLKQTLTWSTIASGVSGTEYTDKKSSAGNEYEYRVTVIVSGTESSETSDEVSATAASPTSYDITVPEKGDKNMYYALGSDFKMKGVSVTAIYANNNTSVEKTDASYFESYENLSYSSEESTDKLKFYLDTSEFNSKTAGTYNIKIMHCTKSGVLGIGTTTEEIGEGKYNVVVLNPTCISSVSASYDYYPKGYSESDFKNTLKLKLVYLTPKTTDSDKQETVATELLSDFSSVTLTNYDNTKVNTEETVSIVCSLCDDKTAKDVKITFVDETVPTNVTAKANLDGSISVSWNKAPGAISYNLYRSTDGTDFSTLVRTVKSSAELDATATVSTKDVADNLDSGVTYYYKVSAIIADSEGDKSAASEGITTVIPAYYEVETKSAKNEFALGEKFSTSGLKVYAYYNVAEDGEEPEYKSRKLDTSKFTANVVNSESATFDTANAFDTIGDYKVSITMNGVTGKTITYVNDGEDTTLDYYTVSVYPLCGLSVSARKKSYPVGYEFDKSDVKVLADYGDPTTYGTDDENVVKQKAISSTDETDTFTIISAPDMTKVGTTSVTVSYTSGGETFTGTAVVNVYDSEAVISVEGQANTDGTASVIFNIDTVKFVKSYIITRSDKYEMDENIKKKTISIDSDDESFTLGFYEYRDTTVEQGKTYYYTVTPKFTDNSTGNASAMVQVSTIIPVVVETITPADDSGVTRTNDYAISTDETADILIVSPPSKDGIDVATFLGDDLTNDATRMKVYKADGETLLTEGIIGTGCIVKLYDSTNAVIDTVIVIIKGDISGDGKIRAKDAKMALDASSSTITLKGAYLIAGNVDGKSGVKAKDAKKILDFASGAISSI